MEMTLAPVRVGICGSETLPLTECANELRQAGYALSFSSLLKSKNEPDYDIFIVGLSEFVDADKLALWKNSSSPFLILGVDSLAHNIDVLNTLDTAVGYIRSTPTLTELLLNLRLGLHWFNERRTHSKRINNIENKIENNRTIGVAIGMLMNNYGESEQYVFDSLKAISRNKQRGISSVAHEIISKHNEDNQTDLNPKSSTSSLQTWLTNNITMKER